MKKDSIIINALILFVITLIAGLLLGLTFNVTAEPRAYQTKLKTEVALNAELLAIKTSHVPELRTGWFNWAPEPKTANCVSCPVINTGVPSGRPVSFDARWLILPTFSPGSLI